MKRKNIDRKSIVILIVVILVILFIVLNCLVMSKKEIYESNDKKAYIEVSDVDRITFKEPIIILNKVDLNLRQKIILDVDNNKKIDNKDLMIMQDIISGNIPDINKDGMIDKNDVVELKKAIMHVSDRKVNTKYDLNYDKKIDKADVDLLQRYISSVIDLDVNFDNEVDNVDINILKLYLESIKQVKVLIPKNKRNLKIKFIVDDDIVDIDKNGVLTAKKEGMTTLRFDDGEETGKCHVIVVDYNKLVHEVFLDEHEIYLSPASLTTVQKSAADINKDNKINAIDLKILKEIISLNFGDVNKNGIVNEEDLIELKKYVHSNKNLNIKEEMDLNYDGYVDNLDVKLLEEYFSDTLLGDVNKDGQVESRDIKLISEYVNSQYQLNPVLDENIAFNKHLEFKSSNTNVLTTTPTGHLYANKEGEAFVTMTSVYGNNAKVKVVVKETNTLPISVKNNKEKVELNYFDNSKYDILEADFNKDGKVDSSDVLIMKNLIGLKVSDDDLTKLLVIIKNKKYDRVFDVDLNNTVDVHDYNILYRFVSKKQMGDINKDKVIDNRDLKLLNDYLNSFKFIKATVKKDNSMNMVEYFSKNSNIAYVSSNGKIVANNKGETEIVSITVNGLMDSTKLIVNE